MEGIKSVISLALESSWGVPVTPTQSLFVDPSGGIKAEKVNVALEALRGRNPAIAEFGEGTVKYTGGYSMAAFPVSLGYLLKSVFGSVNTIAVEAGVVYKHTFTEAFAKPSLTIEQNLAGELVKRFAGYIVKSIKFSSGVDEFVKVEIDGIAKTQVDATPITPSFETARPFTTVDVFAVKIDGVDIKAKVENWELTFDNGLTPFYGQGSKEMSAYYLQGSTCEGSITFYLDSATKAYFDDLIAGSDKALEFTIRGDAIGTSSNYELKIILNKARLEAFDSELKSEHQSVELSFKCRDDLTNGMIKVELTNLVNSY